MTTPLRALILDDSKDDADLLMRELRRSGYEVDCLRTDNAAGMKAALAEREWDVVLSDFSMPGFTGIDALRILQAVGLDIPFVIISGTIGEDVAVEALKAGAHDFLIKGKLARLQPAIERERREAVNRKEIRRAEAALRESESKYRRIVETTQEGIWAVDSDLHTTYMNRRMAELLGGTQEELKQVGVLDFVSQEDRPDVAEAFERSGRQFSQHRELKFKRRDGSDFWASLSATPILEEGDHFVGTLAMVMDVTERRKLAVQIMISDRMASVGTLAAGVAHEINNPLSVVLANVELASRQLKALSSPGALPLDIAELSDELKEAREAASRVRLIVRDLRIFSRAEENETTAPVDVEQVLESTLRMAWNEIRHRAKLVKDFKAVSLADGNESRLGQVFLNLIVNAAQAIAEGRAEDNEIRVSLSEEEAGRICVAITDTGSGMSAEVQKRLFTPFFTTKPPGVGTGLGLSICHKIVTSMGGQIELDSEVGHGTTFRVWLRSASSAVPALKAPVPVAAKAGKRGKILAVDDEAAILSALRKILGVTHEVATAGNGAEALAAIRRGERYELILCDLMMPELTGMDLHEELVKVAPDQARAMVFMTGGAFTARARQFLEEVPNVRIEKPFDADELLGVINLEISKIGPR